MLNKLADKVWILAESRITLLIFNMDFINATNFATTESIIYVNFDLEFLIISFASIILLTLLTSMMVFKIIKKIQPKELIGGVY